MISPAASPTISIIMPIHQGWEKYRPAVLALGALQPAPLEIILVTDGPMTGSCELNSSVPLKIFSTGTAACRGPGTARNLGASAATGEILLFIDSDVIGPIDLIAQIGRAFQNHPEADAVIGSYDAEPGAPNFLSQYKNLLNHYVHQNAPAEVATFWTGCGAIRASVFRALGGMDETPGQLDDVELGFRLSRHGHCVRVCKSIQAKHLKKYSVISLLHSEILERALPWSRIILNADSWPGQSNLQQGQIRSAFLLAAFLGLLLAGVIYPALAWFSLIPAAALLWLNRGFYKFLMAHRGPGFAAPAVFWHWFSFFYAAIVFALVWGQKKLAPFGWQSAEQPQVQKTASALISP